MLSPAKEKSCYEDGRWLYLLSFFYCSASLKYSATVGEQERKTKQGKKKKKEARENP